MTNTTKYSEKLEALKAYLIEEENFTEEEANEAFYDERFDTFQCGSWEYKVFTDEEADEAAREYILDSLWAFNPEFVLSHSVLGGWTYSEGEAFCSALRLVQEKLCENANVIVKALIADVDTFTEHAIREDGRGHFLSFYDGDEIELGEFYAYREN